MNVLTDDKDHAGIDVRGIVSDLGSASGDALSQLRGSAADVAGSVAERAPEVLSLSQETIEQLAGALRASSSDSLVLGLVYSVGVWSGLALARAPRLLMLLAMVPALVLGGTLLTRRVPMVGRAAAAKRSRA